LANDLSINPRKIDTAAAALLGSGPYNIQKIIWTGFSDGHHLVLASDASAADIILDITAVAAVNSKFIQFDFPFGVKYKDLACTTLGGGVVYLYLLAS
jgi:hypothetical protein